MSWIHGRDFVRTVSFLIDRDDIEGPAREHRSALPRFRSMTSWRRCARQPERVGVRLQCTI